MPEWLRPFPGWEHRLLVLIGQVVGFAMMASMAIGFAALMERIWPHPPTWFQVACGVLFGVVLVWAGLRSFWVNIWRPQ